MVTYNDVDYFYVYNLQGDVVALIDANGTQVVEYGYDAWGNPISKTVSLAATIGTLNPFRYRGYVYDEETGLYYLRSRYYNPSWGRFVNADEITSEFITCRVDNCFAYCNDCPTMYVDKDGNLGGFLILDKAGTGGLTHHLQEMEPKGIFIYGKMVFHDIRKMRTAVCMMAYSEIRQNGFRKS